MYIEPNTIIKVLKQIPLDLSYKNTILFDSASEQTSYFNSKAKYTFSNQTYQRVNKNKMRLSRKAEELYDCNYLMFQNTSFGSKWFYAFITKVDYINNVTSEITYEVDVMQSWLFDFTLKHSFVEREHSKTDNIGDNLIEEGLSVGEYVFDEYKLITDDVVDLSAIVGICDTKNVQVSMHSNVFCGAQMYVYDVSTDNEDQNGNAITALRNKLNEYGDTPGDVVMFYMCPRLIAPTPTGDDLYFVGGSYQPRFTHRQEEGVTESTKFGNHTVRNYKLLTYPYTFYSVDNNNGDSMALKYEYFNDPSKVDLVFYGSYLPPVQLTCRPYAYKGVNGNLSDYEDDYFALNTEGLTIGDYPQCSWSTDSFRTWVTHEALPQAFRLVANHVIDSRSAPLSLGEPQDVIVDTLNYQMDVNKNTLKGVTAMLGSGYQAYVQPDIVVGNVKSGGANNANKVNGFFGGRARITEERARVIDDYFDMYGYQTNEVKIPELKTRPEWNYIKTVGCNMVGEMPSDDIARLCNIFDNGITFWHNANHVGNYSLDNSAYDSTPDLH